MEDINTKTTSDAVDSIDVADDKESKRSIYPTRALQFMVPFVAKIYTDLGAGLFHSKEDIGKIHKLSVSTIKPYLSTAQQYGLLELKHGTGYKVTDLFTKIYMPLDDAEKQSGIVDSLRSSQIYSQIFSEYSNRVFPSPTGLVNVVVRSSGMVESIAKKMVEVLFENLRTYNLLNGSGVLILEKQAHSNNGKPPTITKDDNEKTDVAEKNNQRTAPSNRDDRDDEDGDMIKIPIRLKNKRMAYLSFPSEYDDQDLKRIEKVIKAYVNIYNEKDEDED